MSKSPAKVGFISLGCPKATVDSERILTQLRAEGYLIVPTYPEADIVVVNTCGFIDEAIEESLDAIGEALQENGRVIVTGCLGAKGEVVKENFPQVLAVTGPNSLESVMSAIHAHVPPEHDPFMDLVPAGGIKLTPRQYAYIKIAEGCNQKCSFCIIPSMRGKLDSRSMSDVLREAEALVGAGVRELLVVSQDTAAYGVDVKYRTDFWQGRPLKTRITELARELGKLDAWVRLHYVYPYPHVDELVELMAEGLILPYLDVPLQHASPAILKAMRRPADSENMLRRIEHWRAVCPDLTLRSTFIVGFPNESESDFQQLLDFMQAAQLDRVGAFAYSPVEGAAANGLANPVPDEVKEERLQAFMALQSEISAAKLQARIGKTVMVLVDEVTSEYVHGRSAAEAPDIDGVIVLENAVELDLVPGDLVEVTITDADEHDLFAEVILEEQELDAISRWRRDVPAV